MAGTKDYDDIRVGDRGIFSKTITEADIFAFCGLAGDFNPIHVDEVYARGTRWQGRIAHGMLVAGLITRTLSAIGGDGAVHTSQEVSFLAPVHIGDTVTVVSEVVEKVDDKRRLLIDTTWTNQDGATVITGRGELLLLRERKTTV
jgi:3-hydroxybutyryl-CoA dehydratase